MVPPAARWSAGAFGPGCRRSVSGGDRPCECDGLVGSGAVLVRARAALSLLVGRVETVVGQGGGERCMHGTAHAQPAGQRSDGPVVEKMTEPHRASLRRSVESEVPLAGCPGPDDNDVGTTAGSEAVGHPHPGTGNIGGGHRCFDLTEVPEVIDIGVLVHRGAAAAVTDEHRERRREALVDSERGVSGGHGHHRSSPGPPRPDRG